MIDYPPFDQFWIVFGNPCSLQYLKSVANQEEYNGCVKYFHGCLSLIVQNLHLLEIKALFRVTLPAWLSMVDEDIQKSKQKFFESAYDWTNGKIVKKIVAYNNI